MKRVENKINDEVNNEVTNDFENKTNVFDVIKNRKIFAKISLNVNISKEIDLNFF